MRLGNRIGIACVCSLALAAVCPADVITVCWDGTGDYTTIQAAINNASNGDEIVVCPGTYDETINFLGKPVTLRSSHGADSTIIDATGYNGVVVEFVTGEGADTVMIGFTLTGGVGNDGGGVLISDSSPTVINCIIAGNTASDGGGMEITGTGASAPEIINCLFWDNHANVGANPDGGAVRIISNSTPRFTNCTFNGNTAVRCGGAVYVGNSAPVFVNCVFWGNSDAGGTDESAQIHVYNGTVDVTYSCIQGCTSFCSNPDDHNIGDDPQLRNAAAGNLRLLPASPCIDSGDTTALPAGLFTDLDGKGRVLDWADTPTGVPATLVPVTVDMGAYEYEFRCCPVGDCNGDGLVNAFDIDPFVELLVSP